MNVNTADICNPKHTAFFKAKSEKVIFYGGSGSGKSYSVCDRIAIAIYYHKKPLKIVVIRKTMPSLKKTCIDLLQQRFALFGLPFNLNRQDNIARTTYGAQIIFISINNFVDIDKVKSLTDVSYIWVEEASEISLAAYEEIDRRLRGDMIKNPQIFLSFNPVGKHSWLYKLFWEMNLPCDKIQVNVYSNKWATQKYIDKLEALKTYNYNLWLIYCQGEFGSLEDVIFQKYTVVDKAPDNYDESILGLDFGFNVATALVRLYIKEQSIYVEELIYDTGMTNSDLIKEIRSLKIDRNECIYADSAEPDRIQEICEAGFNCYPADKEDKQYGINFVKALDISVLSESVNVLKEIDSYCWQKDKDGNVIDKPTKFMDHAMDAMVYAARTHMTGFTPEVVYVK